jgi:hypothetical protein
MLAGFGAVDVDALPKRKSECFHSLASVIESTCHIRNVIFAVRVCAGRAWKEESAGSRSGLGACGLVVVSTVHEVLSLSEADTLKVNADRATRAANKMTTVAADLAKVLRF